MPTARLNPSLGAARSGLLLGRKSLEKLTSSSPPPSSRFQVLSLLPARQNLPLPLPYFAFDLTYSRPEKPFSNPAKLNSGLELVNSVAEKPFSVLELINSVLEKPFSDHELINAVTPKTFSGRELLNSVAEKLFCGWKELYSPLDKTVSRRIAGCTAQREGCLDRMKRIHRRHRISSWAFGTSCFVLSCPSCASRQTSRFSCVGPGWLFPSPCVAISKN